MILETFDCRFHFIKLSFYRRCVVVIETVGFSFYVKSEIDIESFFLSGIQNGFTFVGYSVCPDDISTEIGCFSIEVVACGPFDI